MNIKIAAAGSVAALLFLSGCAGASDEMTPEASTAETTSAAASPSESMSESMSEAPMEEAGTIVDVAAGNPDFETLVAAVTAADLVETLSGDGPFTVFAPTDDAFDALPEGLLDALLLPENKDALTSILTYHVVSGEVMAADVTAGDVATVEGSTIAITTDGGVMVNDANVVTTDVDASNGVIHVIDKVIVPPTVDAAALLG
ncbi:MULTISPECIES: fasciclin domain-containing protein [unclassified Tessaracoccus]|uniref:fasciclin domain-containing protein n=1 Tax=unclassified Tessaracoccus TaxID=2635419 RepID=UPI001C71D301|nr:MULTISPECIES: fasciclin domain-containing protein [unclassified Tessaracoccus]